MDDPDPDPDPDPEPGQDLWQVLADRLADYEDALVACTDEAQLRTVWALPYPEAGLPVPLVPEDLVARRVTL